MKKQLALAGLIFGLGFAVTGYAADSAFKSVDVRTFSFIETPEPTAFRMENSQFGFQLFVHKIRNSILSENFSNDVVKAKPNFNALLRTELGNNLKGAGLSQLPNLQAELNPSDLWAINYGAIQSESDLIIHIYVDYAGVRSQNTSPYYTPSLYVNFCIVAKKIGNKCLIENAAVYGDNTSKDSEFVYVADPTQVWSTADDVFNDIPGVVSAISSGIKRVAAEVSKVIVVSKQ
jgi:hypothetical protein